MIWNKIGDKSSPSTSQSMSTDDWKHIFRKIEFIQD